MWYLILLFKYDGLITRKTWEIQLQMDFAFSIEIWQSLCIRESENANGHARFAIGFGLCHNLCVHIWKTQLKIQFAIILEKSLENPSIGVNESFVQYYMEVNNSIESFVFSKGSVTLTLEILKTS